MKKLKSRKEILNSLDEMDKAQTEKVLEYIHSVMLTPRDRVEYKRFKESAIQQIKDALKES